MSENSPSYTSFDGHRRIASGSMLATVLAVKQALASGAKGPVLVFDDASGRSIDIDTRGSPEEITARLAQVEVDRSSELPESMDTPKPEARGRGRPKLGVVAREVTLLPRHWEWLAQQPGGASVALRKLVEDARRANSGRDQQRRAQERAYHFMSVMAGDLPHFEEAARALFANDRARFGELIKGWPQDVRDQAHRYAFDGKQ